MVVSMTDHGVVRLFIKGGGIFVEAGADKITKTSVHMKGVQDVFDKIIGKGRSTAVSPDDVG